MEKPRRILVETHEAWIPIEFGEIVLGESDFKKCIIHTWDGGRYSLEMSLKKLEEILSEEDFIRVSRQWLVRGSAIAAVEKPLGSKTNVVLKEGLGMRKIEISADKYRYVLSALI